MAAPYVHDTISNTGTGVTSLSIDLSTLSITNKHSKLVVFLVVKTTTTVAFPSVNGGSAFDAHFSWIQGSSPAQAQIMVGEYLSNPTQAGTLTFGWSGSHDAVAVAFCVEASGNQVYLENSNGGSSTQNTFDATAFHLDGADQLILLAAATNAATLTTSSAPTGFPDHTYGPFTANSAVSVLAIDNDAGAVTSYDPGTWTTSNNGTQGNLVGLVLGFSAYASPSNDDLANAITLYLPAGQMAGVYSGSWLQDDTEYGESAWWNGRTTWYTFTGKGGGWTIQVLGSALSYDLGSTPFEAGGYLNLYEADVGETDASTIYAGLLAWDSRTFSGGANDDRDYSATYDALDNTKQYWVQVDTTYGITAGTFTVKWSPTTGTSASQTPLALGTGQALAPTVDTPSNATVFAVVATGTGQAIAPTVIAQRNKTVTVPAPATGTGTALNASVLINGYPGGYSPGAGGTPAGVGDWWSITITDPDLGGSP